MSLAGKNAIVTGGSRGIGAQIALDLAKQGANVLINYTSDASAQKAADVIAQIESLGNGAKANAIKADVGSEAIGVDMLQAAKSFFGDDLKLHILVHNAGVTINNLLGNIKTEDFNYQINVNLRGPLLITQSLLPYIVKHQGGRIILLSSVSSKTGTPNQTVYAATKAGVEQYANVWANEFGKKDGITINCLNPGPVETDMWNSNDALTKSSFDNNLIATVKEISDLVLLLVDEKARWINGSTVCANGGLRPN